jgi:cereblon
LFLLVEEPLIPHRTKSKKKAFDPTLPSQHLYLGELEREEGQLGDVHEGDEIVKLPLLPMTTRETMIFPGETLPLNTFDIATKMLIRDAKSRGLMIVLACDLRRLQPWEDGPRPKLEDLSHIGVIAEIVGVRDGGGEGDGEEEMVPYGSLMVKLVGRHRCEILECITKVNGTLEGRVVVLPEQLLSPIPANQLACPHTIRRSAVATEGLLSSESGLSLSEQVIEQRLRHVQYMKDAGTLTSVPHWVYQRYQIAMLRGEILKEQKMMTIRSPADSKAPRTQYVPDDPTNLSYWLVKRLPVKLPVKIELLSIDCPTRRIIKGLDILRNFTELHCGNCNTSITKKQYIFSMSVEGPLASYVNPGGYVHDTLTVSKAKNFSLHGRPSTEHSWFPGYAWTILTCRTCYSHLGWRFDASKKNLKPAQFYGLTRASLELISLKQEGDTVRDGQR